MKQEQILVDSNILIYAINLSSPKHNEAQDFLQANVGKLALAHQNILESIRVLTHKKLTNPMSPIEASSAVGSIAEACRIISPDRTTYHIALQMIRKYSLPGDLVFDAYLGATAMVNGVTIIATDNIKDFAVIEEFHTFNPFA